VGVDRLLIVVVLALFAAFMFAAAASLQQHAARLAVAAPGRDNPDLPVGVITRALPLLLFIKKLVRTPIWFFGWLTNLFGFLVQGAALHFGSVALVQPLLATQLLFTLPLGSVWNRCWPLKRDWLAGFAIVAGIVVFLAVRGAAPMSGQPDRAKVLLAGFSAAILVGLLVALASGRRPAIHATLVAVAAGLCFAMSAVLIKLTAQSLVDRGVGATALDWPGYALAVSTLTGLLLEQEAFASGSLAAAVSAMTITNPVASYAIGVMAFHVHPPTHPGQLAAIAGAGLLLVLGTVGLAHSPTVQRELAQDARHQEQLRAPLSRSPSPAQST
jgi:drug/metabolite transporter (DMT)-like permease